MMLEINGLVKKYKDFTLNCSMRVERGCNYGTCRRKRGWKKYLFLRPSWGLSAITAAILS